MTEIVEDDRLGERHHAAVPRNPNRYDEDYRPLPFRRILPIGQLLLCALLLFPYRAALMWEIFHRASRVRIGPAQAYAFKSNPGGSMNFSPTIEFEHLAKAKDNAYDIVSLLNLPGILPQIPFIMVRPGHDEPRPAAIDFKAWRVITWPIQALPFWWMAGRALESLLAVRRGLILSRIGWMSTLISFVVMAGGLAIAIAFQFAGEKNRADPVLRLMSGACLMWGVLSSLTVAAKISHWLLRKRAASALPPVSAP